MNNISIEKWLRRTTDLFNNVDIESARLDAELILRFGLDHADNAHDFAAPVTRTWLIIHNGVKIPENFANDLVTRRLNREPIAYIVGVKEFYDRDFIVTPDVLIPRPESEHIIESLRKFDIANDAKIIDVGTGSGALAITAKLEFPSAKVFATDISDAALSVAKTNANNLGANIEFSQSDLLSGVDETFDFIIANLPYVAKNWDVSPETRAEPDIALYADDDGLELIKKLIVQAPNKLSRNGKLILEMDSRQIRTVANFAKTYGFKVRETLPFTLVLEKT